MGPPHYALSEALIVLVAGMVAWRLAKEGYWPGAAGSLLLGTAAAIGTVRFGFGLIDDLGVAHRMASQAGGATALAFIALQFANPSAMRTWQILVSLTLAASTLIACLVWSESTTVLFLAWLGLAILGALLRPASHKNLRWRRAGVIAIFLFNVLLVRHSPLLGPSPSWHLFHVLIALWILGLWWVLIRSHEPRDRSRP